MTDPIVLDHDEAKPESVCPSSSEAGKPTCDIISSNGCIPDSIKDDDDDWNNAEYQTAEFRMYGFKVLPCTKEQPHRWTNCPFAHSGEHACRRDPRKYEYAAVVCPDLLQTGSCPRGDACNSAHSVFEFWLHPQRYRTQICREGPGCQRRVCFFAHSEDELREVQLPPVEDGVNPFATAKMAKYSMSSIPEKSRKLSRTKSASQNQQQQQKAGSDNHGPKQQSDSSSNSSSNSGSPTCSFTRMSAAQSDQLDNAAPAAVALGGRSHSNRTSSDVTELRRSSSTSTGQQQQETGTKSRAEAAAAVRNRGRLSMDAACWMNLQQSPAAGGALRDADVRTRRRYSLESALQRSAVAATRNVQGAYTNGLRNTAYACSNTAPLPGCNGQVPTVHVALPPRAAGQHLAGHTVGLLQPRTPAGPISNGCNVGMAIMPGAAVTAAPFCGNSPSQWMLQEALQHQQNNACLNDAGSNHLSNGTAEYPSASMHVCDSAPLEGTSLLHQYSIDSMFSTPEHSGVQYGSHNQLPHLMLLRQDSAHDAAAAAAAEPWQQQQMRLQLITPDALSLNAAGPHAGSSSGSLPSVQGAYMPGHQLQQQQQQRGSPDVWCAADPGAALPLVPEVFGPRAPPPAAGTTNSSPCVATAYQEQPSWPNRLLRSTSMGSNSVLPSYPPSSAAAPAPGITFPEYWAAGAAAGSGQGGWGSAEFNLGQPGSGFEGIQPLSLCDLAAPLQQLHMEGTAPADLEEMLSLYQGAATACMQRAHLEQAAADAGKDRLRACIAALSGCADPATLAAAAALLGSPTEHQQQQHTALVHQRSETYSLPVIGSSSRCGSSIAVMGSGGVGRSSNGRQQQLLPSDQLMLLLDEQGGQAPLPQQQLQGQGGAQTWCVPSMCSWM